MNIQTFTLLLFFFAFGIQLQAQSDDIEFFKHLEWKNIIGTKDQKESFINLICECAFLSETFNELASSIENSKVPIKLVHTKSLELGKSIIGRFTENNDPHKIDLNHVLAFPKISKINGEFKYPEGVPKWATTRCMIFAHELAEADIAWVLKENYQNSHIYGIQIENEIRKEYGSSQCRSIDTSDNEAYSVPHNDHKDHFILIGYHTMRIHIYDQEIKVEFEEGKDRLCESKNYFNQE